MSDLGNKQRLFFHLFTQWAVWAQEQGYQFTWGEAKRSDEQAEINALGFDGRELLSRLIEGVYPNLAAAIRNNGRANGILRTAHGNQLAVDLNLFKGGVYQSTTEAWRDLGEHWESLHPDCRWGGRFGDGNHLSMEYGGIK